MEIVLALVVLGLLGGLLYLVNFLVELGCVSDTCFVGLCGIRDAIGIGKSVDPGGLYSFQS